MTSLTAATFSIQKTQNTINEQIWDVGALGYDKNTKRTVRLRPVLKYLYQVTPIDTGKLEKTEWLFVNKEGGIH